MKRVLKNVFVALFVLFGICVNAQNSGDTSIAKTQRTLPTQQEIDRKLGQLNNDGWINPVQSGGSRATGPEQDCENGIVVCGATYAQGTSYTGVGTKNEIPGNTCLGSTKEKNSVWYIVTPQVTGSFGFNLVTAKDYDFAVWDITTGGCASVGNSSPGPVRCNFSGQAGTTGLDATTPEDPTPPINNGAGDSNIMDGMNVTAGNTYAILINNWSADATGYDLTFTGSATIPDATPPTIVSVVPSCTDNTITVTMSEEILCSSIVAGDFTITNTRTTTDYVLADPEIVSIAGVGCATGSFTKTILITHDGSFTSDPYELTIAGPTILDKCNNLIAAPSTEAFNYLNSVSAAGTTDFCDAGDVVSITVTGFPVAPAAPTFSWSPGIAATTATVTAAPTGTTTFTVSVTYGGCTKTATHTATLVDNVVGSISPVNPQVCSGTAVLTAAVTINGTACGGGCTYLWSDGQTTAVTTALAAGTYTVTVGTSSGCPGENTPSSTISIASGGSGTNCFVYYVDSYNGTVRYVETKATPTTLIDALSKAQCTSAIIKMTTGIYALTDRVALTGSMTLEGGFNSDFTIKSSDLSGGANSTTLRRTNTANSDAATICSAIDIAASSVGFRLQDIRIEMPNNAGATVAALADGSGIESRGVNIGAGCSGYSIVRCYIDGGKGANP